MAMIASVALVAVELGISIFLQLFLRVIGLLNQEVQTAALFGSRLFTPAQLAGSLCALALVRSIMIFLVGQSGNISMDTITARLRRIAVWETLLHPAKVSIPASAVNARVGDLAFKSSQFCQAASTLIASIVQTVALFTVMFLTARVETLVALAGLALLGLFVVRLNRITRRVSANVPRELRVLTEGIERVARNTTLVRILRTEKIEHRRLSTAIDAYARHLIHAAYLGNFGGALTPFVGILLIIVIVAASQGIVHTPAITLLSFLYLFVRFVQTISTAVLHFSTCNSTWPSFKDSLDYVATFSIDQVEAAMVENEPLVGRAVEKQASAGGAPPSVEIRSVSYAYPGAHGHVFAGVSADVEKGSQLAIIGPSGCGKSTLLGLVLGLFEPSAGTVRIGGRSPVEFFADPAVRVGYVGAEAFLVAGTIRENLRYGLAVHAEDADLWAALSEAQLRSTVEELPGGLSYAIAEDGSGLSAGQKQRLCLARALLGRPHVLVLDEVSANLDSETEGAIAESLKHLRGKCTTILVSHRAGILKYADHTISLESGTSSNN